MPDAATILTRFALYLDLVALFGIAAFGIYGLRGRVAEGAGAVLRPGLLVAALIAPPLSAFAALMLVAQMGGTPLSGVEAGTVWLFLTEMSPGVAALVRTAALVVALVAAGLLQWRSPASRPLLWTVAASSAIALGTLAWAGHGAMGEGGVGWLQLSSDIVHLLAAGAWVGALVAMGLLLLRPVARIASGDLQLLYNGLHGFAAAGSVFVFLLLASGLLNGWLLMGAAGLAQAPATAYGQLLAVKLLLFALMLGFAAANRFRLTPSLRRGIRASEPAAALRALRISLVLETLAAVAILAIVAVIGLMEPPSTSL
ncbi:copper homeostasis membrane protein CopD [Allosphingosinicella humi]